MSQEALDSTIQGKIFNACLLTASVYVILLSIGHILLPTDRREYKNFRRKKGMGNISSILKMLGYLLLAISFVGYFAIIEGINMSGNNIISGVFFLVSGKIIGASSFIRRLTKSMESKTSDSISGH
jgi:hypothetical protein